VPARPDGGPRHDAFACLRSEAAYLLRFSCIVFSANLLDREDAHERTGIGVDGRVSCRSLNHQVEVEEVAISKVDLQFPGAVPVDGVGPGKCSLEASAVGGRRGVCKCAGDDISSSVIRHQAGLDERYKSCRADIGSYLREALAGLCIDSLQGRV
jgi:hypothetical protein